MKKEEKKVSFKNAGKIGLVIALLVGFFIGIGAVYAADVVIIANPGVSTGSIDANTLKSIYLGKTSKWADGQDINFVMVKGVPVHENFLKAYVKKTESQFNTYWKKMVFTGKGTAPKSFKTEAELVSFVASTPGGIGYVSSGTDVGAAKVLTVN